MFDFDLSNWKQHVVLFVWMFVEAWLGKTDKTKYSSTLELFVMGTVALIKNIFHKEDKK